ncbi:MAG: hypothetical protein WC716_16515 [Chitinophagaceae bacterium]|jgi:hypothetical protein
MKKIFTFFLTLGICFSVFGAMTVNVWDGDQADGKWETAGNWSRGAAPVASDSVVMNATAFACSINTNTAVCSVWVVTSGYSGAIKIPATTKLTVGGKVFVDGTGALTINDTIATTRDGDFHIGSGVGTVTFGGHLKFMGTGNIDLDKAGRPLSLTCSYPGKTATWSGSVITNGTNGILNVMGGTLTLNQAFLNYSVSATPITVVAGTTINGSGQLVVGVGTTNLKYLLPKLIMGGTTSLWLRNGYNAGYVDTFSLSDSIVVPSILITAEGVNNNVTLITNNNHVTTTGEFSFGCTNNAGVKANIITGSSVLRFGTFGNFGSTTYNFGTKNANLGSSLIYCSGNWTTGSATTITAGTSLLTFTGNASFTSSTRTFYDVACSAGALTLADNLTCNTVSTSATGGFSSDAKNLKTADDQTYNGSGILTIGALDTITNGDFIVGATGTKTTAACSLYLGGNALLRSTGTKTTLGRVTFSDAKTYTFTSGDSIAISARQAGDISGGVTGVTKFQSTTPGTNYKLSFPTATSLTYFDVKDCYNFGTLCSAYAVNDTSRGGNTNFYFLNTSNDTTYRDSGNVVSGSNTVYFDTLQIDSVVGYLDTTFNWVHSYRAYNTVPIASLENGGFYKLPIVKKRAIKNRYYKNPPYKNGDVF